MRIFFGATLPDSTKLEVQEIQNGLKRLIMGARLEGRDKLHITLQFIGDFKPERKEELFESVSNELKEMDAAAAATRVLGMRYFPDRHVRRGIWLDAEDDGSLKKIAEKLREVSAAFGVIPEARDYVPHITIARLKERDRNSKDVPDLQKYLNESKLSVEQFFPVSVALFESTLNPDGSSYRILNEFPLKLTR